MKYLFSFLLLFATTSVWADVSLDDARFYKSMGVEDKDILSIREFSNAQRNLSSTAEPKDPISSYETVIPRKTQPVISRIEREFLSAYLNNPNNIGLAKLLALINLKDSILNTRKKQDGQALKRSILALYFLNRAKDLGDKSPWIKHVIKQTTYSLNKITQKNASTPIDLVENHYAHTYFLEAFNYREENRFIAAQLLLDDFVKDPRSVHTVFLNTAVSLWLGSEADYADPTILYDFVVGSYFSVIVMDLAQQLETNWKLDSVNNSRYRMATILGGFSALQRGWLANLHGDKTARALIDDEHRAWRLIQKVFHSFTVGLSFFENEYTFLEAKSAWEDAFLLCPPYTQSPLRTCADQARFTFNSEGMFLAYVDFQLKAGDLAGAGTSLFILSNFLPNFSFWDLGRDAYQHRANNFQEIALRYSNDDPKDDPLHFFLKRKKWGNNMPTCQTCHQAQSKIWSQEEKDLITLPPEEYATVGNWPGLSTTWYGALKK